MSANLIGIYCSSEKKRQKSLRDSNLKPQDPEEHIETNMDFKDPYLTTFQHFFSISELLRPLLDVALKCASLK
jgi:hypothetical protein